MNIYILIISQIWMKILINSLKYIYKIKRKPPFDLHTIKADQNRIWFTYSFIWYVKRSWKQLFSSVHESITHYLANTRFIAYYQFPAQQTNETFVSELIIRDIKLLVEMKGEKCHRSNSLLQEESERIEAGWWRVLWC